MKCIACNQSLPYGERKFLAALYSLSPRAYRVIIERFLLGRSLEQVGREFSVTRERVRQLEMMGVRKLVFRCEKLGIGLNADSLKDYLESVKDELQGVYQTQSYSFDKNVSYEQTNHMGYIESSIPEKVVLSDLESLTSPSILLDDIETLELSVRTTNCLRSANINTVLELAVKNENDIIRIKNLGKKGENDIKDSLSIYGLKLGFKISRKEFEQVYKGEVASMSAISDEIEELTKKEESYLKR